MGLGLEFARQGKAFHAEAGKSRAVALRNRSGTTHIRYPEKNIYYVPL